MTVRFLTVFLCFAAFFGFAIDVWAGAAAPASSCDSAFRNVLNARAWTTAKREVEVAETLILKPDSVLEYTCFLNNANYMAQSAGSTWLSSNFSGNFAGGTYGSGGTCIQMATIWQFLKCHDFDIANFRTFAQQQANDPRNSPACNEPNRNSKWSNNNSTAAPAAATPSSGGGADALVTYLDQMSWWVANNCNSIKPVPTGVMVTGSGTSYEDKVCPLPACYFDPVQLSSKTDDKCR